MAYFYLLGAIVLEVCGTSSMELSQGFTKVLPSVLIEVFYELSFTLQTMVLKKIEVSMAYSIWSGLGTALIAAMGIVYFKESLTWVKLVSLALVIMGVIGLNLSRGGIEGGHMVPPLRQLGINFRAGG